MFYKQPDVFYLKIHYSNRTNAYFQQQPCPTKQLIRKHNGHGWIFSQTETRSRKNLKILIAEFSFEESLCLCSSV